MAERVYGQPRRAPRQCSDRLQLMPHSGYWPGKQKPNKDAVSGRRNGYAPALERRERRQRRQAGRASANGRGSDSGGGGFRSRPLANPSSRRRLGNRRAIRRRAVVAQWWQRLRHCTGRARRPSHCHRWCAFAPKVDSCARPPAAWAINDWRLLLRPVATCWLGRSDGAVADPCAGCISDEKGHVHWAAGGGR